MAVLRAIVAVLNKPPRWLLMLLVPGVAVVVAWFWLVLAAITMPYHPLLLAFLETLDIANESRETITITPIGATETAHRLRELPSYKDDYPPARSAV